MYIYIYRERDIRIHQRAIFRYFPALANSRPAGRTPADSRPLRLLRGLSGCCVALEWEPTLRRPLRLQRRFVAPSSEEMGLRRPVNASPERKKPPIDIEGRLIPSVCGAAALGLPRAVLFRHGRAGPHPRCSPRLLHLDFALHDSSHPVRPPRGTDLNCLLFHWRFQMSCSASLLTKAQHATVAL